MSSRNKLSPELQRQIRERAEYLCEYCHASEKWQYVQFTIDHIIPISQGGTDALDNLALACFHCNRKKTDKTTSINAQSKTNISLFNPRRDYWNDHFIWSADGLRIIGLTEIATVTISALVLNRERVINIRAADSAIGRHPPKGDAIQSPSDRASN
ncbi:HNH endonuclease [Leptolyngbya sp. NIES-3755]|nr:HNH endonuclease [Leptolyngbya sp. NIES-3755]